MRPIDLTVDNSLSQALTCAEFRFPRGHRMPTVATDLTVALRFVLLGIGASHFVLRQAPRSENDRLVSELRYFGTMIAEQLELDRISNFACKISPDCPQKAREIYGELFDRYIFLSKLNGPLDLVLSILVEEFVNAHLQEFGRKFFVFRNLSLERAFDQEAQKSLRYTVNFVERRKLDLEELAEIALIGE
jgi:hypothetical protein